MLRRKETRNRQIFGRSTQVNMAEQELNKQLPIPLYYQFKTVVLNRIRTGELKANDRLPAEDLLAKQYGVSKATVRHALNGLASAGLLRRVQGSGTFVADPRIELGSRRLHSFTKEMRARGLQPSSRVVKQEVQLPDSRLADLLRLRAGARVLCLSRVRLANGQPMALQTVCVPLYLAPGLEDRDFESGSLYEVLTDVYGLIPARAHETHRAVLLGAAEAELLDSNPGAAALKVQRITFDAAGCPFELADSVLRGDRHEIVIELTSGTAKFVKLEL